MHFHDCLQSYIKDILPSFLISDSSLGMSLYARRCTFTALRLSIASTQPRSFRCASCRALISAPVVFVRSVCSALEGITDKRMALQLQSSKLLGARKKSLSRSTSSKMTWI